MGTHATRYAPETPFDAASIVSGQAYTVPKFPFVRYELPAGKPAEKSAKKQATLAAWRGKSENKPAKKSVKNGQQTLAAAWGKSEN